ncbi:DUF6069 family protein [Actinokineospora sp.]|uniref:DUF6069 family protein n=1 Tax=Actinokineospora sp. TaxID=1872133 RepID=UPI00403800FA
MSTTAPHGHLTRTRRRQARVVTVIAAVVAAVAVWAIAGPLLGIDLLVRSGGNPQTVGVGLVIAASLLAGLLAWSLLAVLERFVTRARTVWTSTALIVLVLSVGGPFTAGGTASTTTTLVLMHLAVGAVLISGMPAGLLTRHGAA